MAIDIAREARDILGGAGITTEYRADPPRAEPRIGDHLRRHGNRAPVGDRPRGHRHQRVLTTASRAEGSAMLQGPRLETERLILRVPQAGDFERFAEMFADEPAARHHRRRARRARPRGARFLQMPGAWLVQGFAMFSVIDKASGRWLGQAGPWQPEGWPGTEVGWAFHPDAWGKGYAPKPAQPRSTGRSRSWAGRGDPQHRSGQYRVATGGPAPWVAQLAVPASCPRPSPDVPDRHLGRRPARNGWRAGRADMSG